MEWPTHPPLVGCGGVSVHPLGESAGGRFPTIDGHHGSAIQLSV